MTELKAANNQHVAFIKVGATFVNSIVLTNTTTKWRKGQEVGYFSFGSTVVMLFEKDTIKFTDNVVKEAQFEWVKPLQICYNGRIIR